MQFFVRDYYINALEPGYAEYGSGWTTSSLTGFSALPARYSDAAAAVATWTPTIVAGANYQVSIWNVTNSGSDPAAPVTVNYSGGSSTQIINFTTEPSGWVTLGTYAFAAGSTGNVQLGFSGSGSARTSMVKFLLVQ